MITGYKGTGKDFLHSKLLSGQLMFSRHLPFGNPVYLVFSNSAEKLTVLCNGTARHRFAFADTVKDIVHKKYGDGEKNVMRHLYKHEAELAKLTKSTIWADIVFEKIGVMESRIADITDFRFPIEYETALHSGRNVITTRIFRSEVPIPPQEDTTEHALDEFVTDILILPWFDNFNTVLRLFPQYCNHVFSGTLWSRS